MTKKLSLIVLLGTLGLLTACTAPSPDQESSSQSTSSQSTATQSTQSSQSLGSQITLSRDTDDKTVLLNQTWHFDQFALTTVKGELEGSQQLELEIEWRNLTQDDQRFADIAEISVQQGENKLAMSERDDDFADAIGAQADEDFELTFRLHDQTQPVKISVTPKQGAAKTLTVNLDQ